MVAASEPERSYTTSDHGNGMQRDGHAKGPELLSDVFRSQVGSQMKVRRLLVSCLGT